MSNYLLKLELLSDTTFGSGEGVAGLIDVEVQHDANGCPYLGGRALRGLLVEECASILEALRLQGKDSPWGQVAQRLFGKPGSREEDRSILHIGDARLPEDLCRAIDAGIKRGELTPTQVLDSLTSVRRQTAIEPKSGSARERSLRASRVILRKTTFVSRIRFLEGPEAIDLELLAACCKVLRRAGLGRNRGRGEVKTSLLASTGNDITASTYQQFRRRLETRL